MPVHFSRLQNFLHLYFDKKNEDHNVFNNSSVKVKPFWKKVISSQFFQVLSHWQPQGNLFTHYQMTKF